MTSLATPAFATPARSTRSLKALGNPKGSSGCHPVLIVRGVESRNRDLIVSQGVVPHRLAPHIHRQYDEMVKYATALRLGTAQTEAILRRFTRSNVQHPTYKALYYLIDMAAISLLTLRRRRRGRVKKLSQLGG
jgi:hypothetical protein